MSVTPKPEEPVAAELVSPTVSDAPERWLGPEGEIVWHTRDLQVSARVDGSDWRGPLLAAVRAEVDRLSRAVPASWLAFEIAY